MSPTREHRRERYILWLLGVLVAAGLAWWWLSLEWVEEEVDLGFEEAARRNPFLAAEMFLQKRTIETRNGIGFGAIATMSVDDEAIAHDHLLMLDGTYGALRDEQVETLWQWMAYGGRVIAVVENRFVASTGGEADALLSRVGVELVSWDSDEMPGEWDDSQPVSPPSEAEEAEADDGDVSTDPASEPSCEPTPGEETVASSDAPPQDAEATTGSDEGECEPATALPVALNSGLSLSADLDHYPYFRIDNSEMTSLARQEDQHYLLRTTVGDGELILLNAATPFENHYIDRYDHAHLLATLADNREQVWILRNRQSPSFWKLVWHMAPAASVCLMVALGLWLWSSLVRFGPVYREDYRGQRSFVDHIRANGQFFWRHGQQQRYCQRLRHDIHQRMHLRHPEFHRLSAPQQVDKLCQISGLDQGDVDTALHQAVPQDGHAFTALIQRLQFLRNCL